MPVLYGLDAGRRLVHLVTIGDASFDEWRDALLGVFANSSFRTGFDFLSDRRRGAAMSRVFIERVAAFAREHCPESHLYCTSLMEASTSLSAPSRWPMTLQVLTPWCFSVSRVERIRSRATLSRSRARSIAGFCMFPFKTWS